MIAECRDCGERFAFDPRVDDIQELDHDHDWMNDHAYSMVFSEISEADEHALAILEHELRRLDWAALETWKALRQKRAVRRRHAIAADSAEVAHRWGLASRVLAGVRASLLRQRRLAHDTPGGDAPSFSFAAR